MPEIIGARADVGRIEDHVRRSLRAALARGGEIAAAAQSRLAPAVASIDAASALAKSTEDAEATAWAVVTAEDTKADTGIGAVRDAMWNALGRPRTSPLMDQVFPGGVGIYTSGDPRGQPVLMQILKSRIATASAPQWTQALRDNWAAEIDALLTTYSAALETHRPMEAAATVAAASFRAAIRTAHARLAAFKRDLLSLGLTQSQVHELIPDASTGGGSPAALPANGAGPTPTPPGGGTAA